VTFHSVKLSEANAATAKQLHWIEDPLTVELYHHTDQVRI